MSVDYVWVCDARKEFIDPYPLHAPHLFVMCRSGLAELAPGDLVQGWAGETIRLLSDHGGQNDEYYMRTSRRAGDDDVEVARQAEAFGGTLADVYTDVTSIALELAARDFPERWWTAPIGADAERLGPIFGDVPGSCSKQCHAISCASTERHGCHDSTCLTRFGME